MELFCLLITFANSVDPNEARRFVGPDLDSNCLTHDGIESKSTQRVKYGTMIRCERIIKAILENQKADHNIFFSQISNF